MNSITIFLFFVPVLSLILLSLNLVFAPHNPYQEKSSTFECGFHSFLGQNRTQFNISFFVFGLLFLTFDLELVMALPGLITIYNISVYGISIMLIFFAILTIGFAFELGKKALSIDSRQHNINAINSSMHIYPVFKYIILPVKMSLVEFINKFKLVGLIKRFIKLKIISLCLAYCLYLLNIITVDSIWILSCKLILLFIVYKFTLMPWRNNNIINFFITMLFNSFILSSMVVLIILIFNIDINVLNFIAFSTLLYNDTFGFEIICMDPEPNDGGFNGEGSNGEGPSNGGPPNRDPRVGPISAHPYTQNDQEERPYPSPAEVRHAKVEVSYLEHKRDCAEEEWQLTVKECNDKWSRSQELKKEYEQAEAKQHELEDNNGHPDELDRSREETASKEAAYNQADQARREADQRCDEVEVRYDWYKRSAALAREKAIHLEYGNSDDSDIEVGEEGETRDPEDDW